MPKVDYIFRGGLSKVYVCRQGGRGGQKSRKSDDVFYERPLAVLHKDFQQSFTTVYRDTIIFYNNMKKICR